MATNAFVHACHRRRGAILLVALVMFCLAQAAAIAHAANHWGADAAGLPGDHAQLCTDCASLLPFTAVAGGLAAGPLPVRAVARVLSPPPRLGATGARQPLPFRSRAPPR